MQSKSIGSTENTLYHTRDRAKQCRGSFQITIDIMYVFTEFCQ